ncbi:MAG: hypothetical protein I8H87_11135 [Comamonadaceae bacterium]|jgi:hypothetical protein|nr:hypothetical protein [Comamonadaceae bacterium]
MALVVFFLIAVISATVWHHYVSRYLAAALGATGTTVVLFQAVAFLQLGHLDPFFPIAVITSSLVALPLSLLVGLPIRVRRRRTAIDPNAR